MKKYLFFLLILVIIILIVPIKKNFNSSKLQNISKDKMLENENFEVDHFKEIEKIMSFIKIPIEKNAISNPTIEEELFEEEQIKSAKISFTGDLMAHIEQVNDAFSKGNTYYNFDYTFSFVKDYLNKSDYTVGNLETVFAGKKYGYSGYPMFNTPDLFALAIKNAGFKLLTTANNHSNDKGEYGIIRTIELLNYLEIDHVGTYKSIEERDNILIKNINGIVFAFISYTYGTNGLPLTKGKPFLCNLLDEKIIRKDLSKAKELNPDFIVVLPHMGNEYELIPNNVFRNWTKIMFDAGADIIMASHPHVLQPAEKFEILREDGSFKKCFVVYSLGNFVSAQRTIPRDTGVIFNLYFEKKGNNHAELKKISFVPTWVKYVNKNGNFDIIILPIYDILKQIEQGLDVDLRKQDIEKIKNANVFATKTYLKESISFNNAQKEYYILNE